MSGNSIRNSSRSIPFWPHNRLWGNFLISWVSYTVMPESSLFVTRAARLGTRGLSGHSYSHLERTLGLSLAKYLDKKSIFWGIHDRMLTHRLGSPIPLFKLFFFEYLLMWWDKFNFIRICVKLWCEWVKNNLGVCVTSSIGCEGMASREMRQIHLLDLGISVEGRYKVELYLVDCRSAEARVLLYASSSSWRAPPAPATSKNFYQRHWIQTAKGTHIFVVSSRWHQNQQMVCLLSKGIVEKGPLFLCYRRL